MSRLQKIIIKINSFLVIISESKRLMPMGEIAQLLY